ncbi:hypothetical protein WR25_09302 isoform A [Diploscapter pachys]|uniref:Fibronectin type-III domain-containing protein n=2 Tax=Diploscapter pachys TaxID=2018661 RepID=A0A2A2L104_9BILA|nr:hypothetical protein WR25_09302 isoform A [Diploscapter pachys]
MIGSTFETIKKHGITDEDVKEGLYIKNLEPGDEGEYTCYLKGHSDCRTVISLKVKQVHHPTELKFDEMPQKSLLECCSVSNMKAQSFCSYDTHIDPKADLSSLSAWNAEYAVEYSWSYRAESIKPYARTLINSEPDDADFVIFRNCLNHIPSEVQLPETIGKSSFMRTCCKNSFIPTACCVAPEDDEKAGNTTFAKCKKYMPLILSCHKLKFDASYVIFPPTDVSIRGTTHETMQVCWKDTVAYKSPGIPDFNMTNSENSTEYSGYTLLNYTIFYKEVPKSLMAMSSDDTFFPLLLADSAITAPEADATNHDQTGIVQTLADLVASAKNAGYDEKFTNNFMRKFSANLNKFHNTSTNSTCGNVTNLRFNSTYLIYVIGHYKIEQMEVETIPSELVLGTTEDLQVDKLELADRLNRLCSSSITNKNCTFICNVTRKFTFEENLMLANGICRIDGNESKSLQFRLPALFGIERQRECCNRKKIPAECMPLCTGQSLNQSDPFFQSCVALHLHAVYQCYQEHLDLLPPSFSSVSASDVTDTSAVLHWEWPADCDVCQNALCQITLYRSQNTREGTIHYRSTINLSSKRFNNLEPDTEYLAKMDSISNDVVRYYSFAKPSFVIFRTKVAKASHVCPLGGLPLQLEENMLVSCSRSNPCPEFYTCADSGYQSICCPKTILNATMDFRKCCVKQGVGYGCAQHCTLKQSMPSYCKPHFKAYLICAAEATVRLGDSPQTRLIDSLASQYANRVRGVPLDIVFGCLFFGSLGYSRKA